MKFQGDKLLLIVAKQRTPLLVLDCHHRLETEFKDPQCALRFIAQGGYVGEGNTRRIRYIKPAEPDHHRVPWASNRELGQIVTIAGYNIQAWPDQVSPTRSRTAAARGRKTWPQNLRKARAGKLGSVRFLRIQAEPSEA